MYYKYRKKKEKKAWEGDPGRLDEKKGEERRKRVGKAIQRTDLPSMNRSPGQKRG